MSQVAITGNTYPVKEKLKALGAKWNKEDKVWMITDLKLSEANAIVANQAPQVAGKCSKCGGSCKPPYTLCLKCKPGPSRCKQCGAVPNARGWPRIYKNGICSDCYRDEREEAEMGY